MRHLEEDLRGMVDRLEGDDEDALTRITALRAELHRLQEIIHTTDLELGEEAALFRGLTLEG